MPVGLTSNLANGWLNIGKVGKAHGLRGAFFVRGRDEPFSSAYKNILVGESPEKAQEAKVLSCRWQNSQSVLLLSIASDRTTLEALIGQSLWVRRDQVQIEDEQEFLWQDLENRQVVDDQGSLVGSLQVVYNSGAADIAVIKNPEKGELEIALVADYFDMNFSASGPIRLVVVESLFDELWLKK